MLLLRGPQTPGELRARSERLHAFGSTEEVEQTLSELAERRLADRLPRRPGQKEERFVQRLLGDDEPEDAHLDVERESPDLEERVASLEAEVARLRRLVEPEPQ